MKPDKNPSKKFIKRFQKIYTNNIYTYRYAHAHMLTLTHIHTLTYTHTKSTMQGRRRRKEARRTDIACTKPRPFYCVFLQWKRKASQLGGKNRSVFLSFLCLYRSIPDPYLCSISGLFWKAQPSVCQSFCNFITPDYYYHYYYRCSIKVGVGAVAHPVNKHTASLISWFKSWIRS